jgi:hypothetical protein
MAVEIDGCEILTRSDAKVMLPVSAVAMKYSIWRSVYLMCGVSPPQRDVET